MRSLLLLSVLALGTPAFASDDPDGAAEAHARDAKAEYAKVVRLIDEWFEARDSDQQRTVGILDGKLTYWYQQELADQRRVGESSAAAETGGKKRKKKGSTGNLDSAADMLDATTEKDYARLRAVTQELADMQPSFDRMEANAMMYLNKGRKLRELQALAKAEITEPPPKAPEPPKVVEAVEKEAGAEGRTKAADAKGAAGEAREAAAEVAEAAPAPPAPPPPPKLEMLDEEVEEKKPKKVKEKKAKKEKDKKAEEPAPAAPRSSIEDLDE